MIDLVVCQTGDPALGERRRTLRFSTQRVQIIQRALADRVFKVPRDRVRVVAPDTGGGFGQKNGLYPEYVLCLEASRQLGRPVKWVPDRADVLSAGCHARDNLFSVSASLDASGRITSIAAIRTMNIGAYTSSRPAGIGYLLYPLLFMDIRVRCPERSYRCR